MPISPTLSFSLPLLTDGSSTTVTVDMRNTPFTYPSTNLAEFSLASNLPSTVINCKSQLDGSPVSASISGHTLTLVFPTAPTFDGTLGVQGIFTF